MNVMVGFFRFIERVARLMPPHFIASEQRTLGLGKDKFTYPEGFDQLSVTEIKDIFYQRKSA